MGRFYGHRIKKEIRVENKVIAIELPEFDHVPKLAGDKLL